MVQCRLLLSDFSSLFMLQHVSIHDIVLCSLGRKRVADDDDEDKVPEDVLKKLGLR